VVWGWQALFDLIGGLGMRPEVRRLKLPKTAYSKIRNFKHLFDLS
jgi:hypothetical protein